MRSARKILRDIYMNGLSKSVRWKIFSLRRWLFFKMRPISNLNRHEFRYYSQNGEDGILHAIFSKIGTTNKYFVEFGVDDGGECNTRFLRECRGWQGLMMDGRPGNPPHIKQEFITAENINGLFEKYQVPEKFDLLSIDVDGNDYWIWKALGPKYQPRVLIIEYNATVPFGKSLSVQYEPGLTWDGTNYFGASLSALLKISEAKGYRLAACDLNGVNAFFIREDLIQNHFTLPEAAALYKPPGFGNPPGSGHRPCSRPMIEV